jgi:hypothetical protein
VYRMYEEQTVNNINDLINRCINWGKRKMGLFVLIFATVFSCCVIVKIGPLGIHT